MKGLLLAVDVGNTTLEIGIYKNDKLLTSWRLSSLVTRTPDECWQSIVFFAREAGIDPHELKAMAIGSVVPDHTRSYLNMAKSRFDSDPLIISVESCPFLEVNYDDPRQVGADRLCNAYAGFHYYGGPLIVVDFGTAVTLDIIAEEGAYQGGIILPGPLGAARSLHQKTAQLPMVSLKFPDKLIGTTTDNSIRTGVTWGIVDMVDSLIERINAELGVKQKVVSTGGLAEPFAVRSRNFQEFRSDLTLEGVRLLYLKTRTSA
ncbi:type III pantothenate kinase [bacterium]|nr:type III pantothenate kinase [bacterium]